MHAVLYKNTASNMYGASELLFFVYLAHWRYNLVSFAMFTCNTEDCGNHVVTL